MSAVGFSEGPRPIQVREAQRAAEILVDVLSKSGVEVVFGIPGGAIAPVYDALIDRPEIRVVTVRHESGAMFAAAAYARAAGKPAAVLVTSGPGALNCMTGLASASCDSLPVLVIAGEVPRRFFGKGALQEGSAHRLNVVGAAKSITKLSVEASSGANLGALVGHALHTAVSGRPGPVFVSVPLDVSSDEVERAGCCGEVEVVSRRPREVMKSVATTLLQSQRPVIFAGSGARWGDGPKELRRLAETLQCPVMTTPKGKGAFPESHPLSLGVFGHGGHPSATEYLEGGIDSILAVGTGLSDPATNGWSSLLVPSGQFIQIDAEASRFGVNYDVTLGIVGKAGEVLREISSNLPRGPRSARSFGVRRLEDPSLLSDGPSGQIPPHRAIWEIQQSMPSETIFVVDIGEHLLWATHYLETDDPQGYLCMTGLASMGTSLASAVGARLAQPNRPVVAICGDGCFAMCLSDLSTAVRERLPLVIMVLNDRRYGMVEIGNTAVYGRTPRYPSDEMSIGRLAEGMGATSMTLSHRGEISGSEIWDPFRTRPLVVDVRIDPAVVMPKHKRFEELKQTVSGLPR